MPYWIADSLAGTPVYLWVYLVVGVPWALVVLPRRDWQRPLWVLALAFALGPALTTTWMFALATIGGATETPLLRFDLIFAGTVVLAAIGALIAWRRRWPAKAQTEPAQSLARDAWLLIGLIGAALIVRWVVIAYWPFTAYDTLWVYGYQGRLYALLGYIPQSIGYYPQFVSLQYTLGQLAVGGINDHAARAVILLPHIGSIAAAHVLGHAVFNWRTGLFTAAIWALYPHVGEWSRAGDLEIPLAFLFTLAAAFFLRAWLFNADRRRNAVIAGLMLGVGLWTKPTMGAFVWGVLLLLALDLARVRFNLRAWRPRFEVAFWAGLATIPMGGMWYLRNILLGHAPVDFPPAFWLTQAARSGVEFGWPLLFLFVFLAYLFWGSHAARPNARGVIAGAALVLAGLLPSILSPQRMTLIEWAVLAAGAALLTRTLWGHARRHWDAETRAFFARIGWSLALALPYFITWFFSYSYHYRLSFAIVPLLVVPTAAILARWLTRERIVAWAAPRRAAYLAAIALLGLPGVFSAVYDINAGGDYLWTDALPDDEARYRSGNAALMNLVDGLEIYQQEHPDQPLVVSAPKVDRLPFFFPLEDIDVDSAPRVLTDLEDAAYFIYGVPESPGAYEGAPMHTVPVLGALGRTDIMRRAWGMDDGDFRYDVYELHLDQRLIEPQPNGVAQDDVVFGGFARYLGYEIGGLDLWPGRRVVFKLMWQVLETPPQDYSIFIHLLDRDGNLIANWDGPVARTEAGYYATHLWEPGEYIVDERVIALPDGVAPVGQGYELRIGFYDPLNDARVPVQINGAPGDSGYTIDNRLSILAQQP